MIIQKNDKTILEQQRKRQEPKQINQKLSSNGGLLLMYHQGNMINSVNRKENK